MAGESDAHWARELVARRGRLGANASALPSYSAVVAVMAEFPTGAVAHFTPAWSHELARRLRARGPKFCAQADALDEAALVAEKVKVSDDL